MISRHFVSAVLCLFLSLKYAEPSHSFCPALNVWEKSAWSFAKRIPGRSSLLFRHTHDNAIIINNPIRAYSNMNWSSRSIAGGNNSLLSATAVYQGHVDNSLRYIPHPSDEETFNQSNDVNNILMLIELAIRGFITDEYDEVVAWAPSEIFHHFSEGGITNDWREQVTTEPAYGKLSFEGYLFGVHGISIIRYRDGKLPKSRPGRPMEHYIKNARQLDFCSDLIEVPEGEVGDDLEEEEASIDISEKAASEVDTSPVKSVGSDVVFTDIETMSSTASNTATSRKGQLPSDSSTHAVKKPTKQLKTVS